MEEKFLKARQEREEQRQQRSKEGAEVTALRQQYEAEAEHLEAAVTQLLSSGNTEEAQQRIDSLRKLVQDTSNSISLTAHEMAKANSVLANLQQLVDDKKSSAASTKRFKFSSRLKAKTASDGPSTGSSPTNTPAAAATAEPSSSANGRPTDAHAAVSHNVGGAASGFGNSYGPSDGTDLFIAHSKGVFINGCHNCTIYCLPIAGSVFLSNCTHCRVYVACHQLRLKDCHDSDLYVWCASTPIIESCDGIRFGPYARWTGLLAAKTESGVAYASHAEWVRNVGEIADTARTETNYTNVDDFQWVRKTASPHWRVLTAAEEAESSTAFAAATPPN